MAETGSTTVLAVDLGAESGRVCVVTAESGRLRQLASRRFSNVPVNAGGILYWDVLALWREVESGITHGRRFSPASVGVDSWAVDFGLVDDRGDLLGNPIHYRDARTRGMLEKLLERLPREQLFAATGTQMMPINTSVQLLSMAVTGDPRLVSADKLLMIPDLMHMWLCGARVTEHTNASTTQLFDQLAGTWSRTVLDAIGVERHLMPEVVAPGTPLGDHFGLPVIAPATHDTASAVAAVPARDDDFAYISSGTWSLVGLEVDRPHTGPAAVAANVTNEGGVLGTTRLLKNVTGLWILQQCLQLWRTDGLVDDYRQVARLAAQAAPLVASFDVDHEDFLAPGDHTTLIRSHCARRGSPQPASVAEIARAIFESLAFAYRRALEKVERVAGRTASVIHVVGGGARNELLCQLTADATGRLVVAGPVEATVLGNAGLQLVGLGCLPGLPELREHVRRGTRLRRFQPARERDAWESSYERWSEANERVAGVTI